MFRKTIAASLFLLLSVPQFKAHAEDIERDRCSCKLAMKGSQSTLKDGTCVRTETTSTCLMEWGGGSKTKLSEGKGLSQSEAEVGFLNDSKYKFEIPQLVLRLAPGDDAQLSTALTVLSTIPPDEYGKIPGIADSFVLAAGSALFRFSKSSLAPFTASLLQTHRADLITAVQKEGQFKFEQYEVRGHSGCLQVTDFEMRVNVTIKTPFTNSEGC